MFSPSAITIDRVDQTYSDNGLLCVRPCVCLWVVFTTADFVHDAFQTHHLIAGGAPLVGIHDPNGAGAVTTVLLERNGFFTKASFVRANVCHADLLRYGIGVKEWHVRGGGTDHACDECPQTNDAR